MWFATYLDETGRFPAGAQGGRLRHPTRMAELSVSAPRIYRLRVVLRGVSPPVWRHGGQLFRNFRVVKMGFEL
jgi:hypothetical protein